MTQELKPGCCHKCGLPLSENPHPEAGKPGHYLEVGCPTECIPCTVLSRHTWAERAQKAESELRELRKQLAAAAPGADAELLPYLRQYRHNDGSDGFVFAYEKEGVDRHVALLRSELVAPGAAPVRITGEQLYQARYGHEGGKWSANEHQGDWNEWAERLNAQLAAQAQTECKHSRQYVNRHGVSACLDCPAVIGRIGE